VQDNFKSYLRIFLKFWGYVGNGINYQWFNFGGDPEGILDSGSLWNLRYHCFQWGIRETAAKPTKQNLAKNIALAEVYVLWLLSSFQIYLRGIQEVSQLDYKKQSSFVLLPQHCKLLMFIFNSVTLKRQCHHICFKLVRVKEKYTFYWDIDFAKFFVLYIALQSTFCIK